MTKNMIQLVEAVREIWDEPETKISTWFERDRAHVDLVNANTDETIIEWWDDAVHQAVEDGFLDPNDWHGSALQYARDMDLI